MKIVLVEPPISAKAKQTARKSINSKSYFAMPLKICNFAEAQVKTIQTHRNPVAAVSPFSNVGKPDSAKMQVMDNGYTDSATQNAPSPTVNTIASAVASQAKTNFSDTPSSEQNEQNAEPPISTAVSASMNDSNKQPEVEDHSSKNVKIKTENLSNVTGDIPQQTCCENFTGVQACETHENKKPSVKTTDEKSIRKPHKAVSIESIIRNLNMKQSKGKVLDVFLSFNKPVVRITI